MCSDDLDQQSDNQAFCDKRFMGLSLCVLSVVERSIKFYSLGAKQGQV